jgi:U3 small nucleolar RNA-associated protein 5
MAPKESNKTHLQAFDTKGDYFAIVMNNTDGYILKIWDVLTNNPIQEYTFDCEISSCCFSYLPISTLSMEKNKKKRKQASSTNHEELPSLALGCSNGQILLYSMTRSKVVAALKDQHVKSVSAALIDGKHCFSICEDNKLVKWDLNSLSVVESIVLPVKLPIQRLSISESTLLMAHHSIFLYDLESKTLSSELKGHDEVVDSIVVSPEGSLFVSSSLNSRSINVWNINSKLKNKNGLITIFNADSNVRNITFTSNSQIAVQTENGKVYFFEIKKKTATPSEFSFITAEKSVIQIFNVKAVDGCLITARGNELMPVFEKVKVEDILSQSELIRDAILLKQTSLEFSKKDETMKDVNFVLPTDYNLPDLAAVPKGTEEALKKLSEGLSLEDQLAEKMTIKEVGSGTLTTDSMTSILIQALHTNDIQLLEDVLHVNDAKLISSTLEKLPSNYVIPFLNAIIERFEGKYKRGYSLMAWIKAIFVSKMSYLVTIPDFHNRIRILYNLVDSRLHTFDKVMKLYGRLDLVVQQVLFYHFLYIDCSKGKGC